MKLSQLAAAAVVFLAGSATQPARRASGGDVNLVDAMLETASDVRRVPNPRQHLNLGQFAYP